MSDESDYNDTKNITIEKDTTLFTSITTASNDHQPRARLCHLKKWPHFQGYGFNLHAEKHKSGQHIGKVDANSPAESAGLREGDRIIEVNNVNISNENHQQVVKRIRNGFEDSSGQLFTDEVLLLVLDSDADAYFRSINVIVKSDFKNLLRITTKTASGDDEADQKEETPANNMLTSNSLSSVSQKSVDNNNNNVSSGSNKDIAALSPDSSRGEAVTSGSNLSVSSHNQSSTSVVSVKAPVKLECETIAAECAEESSSNETENEGENKHGQANKTSSRQHNEASQLSQIDANQARFYQDQIHQQADSRRTSKNSKVDPFRKFVFLTAIKKNNQPTQLTFASNL